MRYKFSKNFISEFESLRNKINLEITRYINSIEAPERLHLASFHLIKSGGKRIRPIILIKICELFGCNHADAMPAAVAIEFLHNFTLIHDDIMDRDEFRRGVRTTHIVYGDSMALLAGDFLFSIVFNILSGKYDDAKVRKLVNIFSEASMKICRGQAMDIEPDLYIKTIDDYLEMIYLKTASLIEAAVLSGVVISGNEEFINDMKIFGMKIGLAFQIADDLLGILGDPKKTGKPVGSDIRNGKKTLPILYTLEKLSGDELNYFKNIFGNETATDDDVKSIVNIMERVGAIQYSRKYMIKLADEALSILSKFNESPARNFMTELVNFIIYREL